MIITNTINQFINLIIITIISIIKLKFIKIIDKIQIVKKSSTISIFFIHKKVFIINRRQKRRVRFAKKFKIFFVR